MGFRLSGSTPGLVIGETQWVWHGDLEQARVRVPVRLYAGERANFLQFSIDFDDEWLEYMGFVRSSSDWMLSAFDPIVLDADEGLVRGVLYRRGGIPRAPPEGGEHLFDLIFDVNVEALPADTYHRYAPVAFTAFDATSLTQNPREETILGDLDGDDEAGSLDPLTSILADGGVDILYADGLEIGSGALTNRAQRLVLPIYATRIAGRDGTLTIGVDYDELILRTRRVRGIGRAGGENGEARSVEIIPRFNGRGVEFTLTISADGNGSTRLLRAHVANLELDFLGSAGPAVGSVLTMQPLFGDGFGGGAGILENGGPGGGPEGGGPERGGPERGGPERGGPEGENSRDGDVARVAVPGELEILPPWFVRGNVASSIEGNTIDGELPDGASTIAQIASIQPRLRDGLAILQFLFNSSASFGTRLSCLQAADANGDGHVLIDDSVLILNYLYIGGQPPVAPFPAAGVGPDDDDLGCERSLPIFERG